MGLSASTIDSGDYSSLVPWLLSLSWNRLLQRAKLRDELSIPLPLNTSMNPSKRWGVKLFSGGAIPELGFSCLIRHGLLKMPLKGQDMPLLLPGLPPFQVKNLPVFLSDPNGYNWGYLVMKVGQFAGLDNVDWVFANSFEGLEDEVAEAISKCRLARLIGPMVLSAYLDGQIKGDKGYGGSLWEPLSEDCANFLNKKNRKINNLHFLRKYGISKFSTI